MSSQETLIEHHTNALDGILTSLDIDLDYDSITQVDENEPVMQLEHRSSLLEHKNLFIQPHHNRQSCGSPPPPDTVLVPLDSSAGRACGKKRSASIGILSPGYEVSKGSDVEWTGMTLDAAKRQKLQGLDLVDAGGVRSLTSKSQNHRSSTFDLLALEEEHEKDPINTLNKQWVPGTQGPSSNPLSSTLISASQSLDVNAGKLQDFEVINLEEEDWRKQAEDGEMAARIAQEVQEKAAKLAQEAEEWRNQEYQNILNSFLTSFENAGISTNAKTHPGEAKWAVVTSHGLAAVLQFVYVVRKENEETVQMLRTDNDNLRAALIKSRDVEGRILEDFKAFSDNRSQRIWKSKMKAERDDLESQLKACEQKLDKLRVPDVTLEKINRKITSFENQVVNMGKEVEKLRNEWNQEKKLSQTARLALTKDFKIRKNEVERFNDNVQALEINLDELSGHVKKLEFSIPDIQQNDRSNGIISMPMDVTEDIASLKDDLEDKEGRLGVLQNDLDVLRDHMAAQILEDANAALSQPRLNRAFADAIRGVDHKFLAFREEYVTYMASKNVGQAASGHTITVNHTNDNSQPQDDLALLLNHHIRDQQEQETRITYPAFPSSKNYHDEASHVVNLVPEGNRSKEHGLSTVIPSTIIQAQGSAEVHPKTRKAIERLERIQADLNTEVNKLAAQIESPSTSTADFQDEINELRRIQTVLDTKITKVTGPPRNDLDGLMEEFRLLDNKINSARDDFKNKHQNLEAELNEEKLQRIQGDLKAGFLMRNGLAVCSRNFKGLWGFTQSIWDTVPCELKGLAKAEEAHCKKSSRKMQKWNDRLLECLRAETDDLARETMIWVKKMRKGETLPAEFKKWNIVEKDDDVLLECVEMCLRRILNTEDIWKLKFKSSNIAFETE